MFNLLLLTTHFGHSFDYHQVEKLQVQVLMSPQYRFAIYRTSVTLVYNNLDFNIKFYCRKGLLYTVHFYYSSFGGIMQYILVD